MAQRIGVQAVMETVEFLKGLRDYMGGLQQGEHQTTKFADTAQGPASAGIDAFGQIAIGALRKVGEVAMEWMGKAVQAVGQFAAESLRAGAESEVVWARLGAVIAAMGDNTDMTVGDVEGLAAANKDLFRGNDELVASVVQVGLSMGTVSKDQMPTFLQQVADLAAITGTDATSAARLFAQAYEDPISTLRRFRSQNILVDQATQDTIKSLVEQGKTGEAAALLLERVGQVTAGAAETMADTTEGRFAIFREHMADMQEGIGRSILASLDEPLQVVTPLIEEFGQGLADWLTRPEVMQGLQDLASAAIEFIEALKEGPDENSPLMKFLRRMGAWWDEHGPALQAVAKEVFGKIGESVQALSEQVGPFVEDVLDRLGTWFEDNGPLIEEWAAAAGVAFANIVNAVTTAWTFIEPLLSGLLDLILGVFKMAMQVATGDWDAAWETLKTTAEGVWEAIKTAIGAFADWVAGWFGTTWQGIKDTWAANWENLKLILSLAWDRIRLALATKAAEILLAMILWVINLRNRITAKFEEIVIKAKEFIDGVRDAIRAKIGMLTQAGTDLIAGFWNGIRDRIETLMSDLRKKLQAVETLVRKIFLLGSPSRLFMGYGADLMEGLAMGIDRAAGQAMRSMQMATSMVLAPASGGTQSVDNSRRTEINLDFEANYARTQSPVTVRDDVQSILAGVRR